MTTPTIKQMRAWQRQLGSMERKADEIAREMAGSGVGGYLWQVFEGIEMTGESIAKRIVAAKSEARNGPQGFAAMDPERVSELSRMAVAARQRKKTA